MENVSPNMKTSFPITPKTHHPTYEGVGMYKEGLCKYQRFSQSSFFIIRILNNKNHNHKSECYCTILFSKNLMTRKCAQTLIHFI